MNVCIVTACFLGNANKWTIYRENFDEVTYEIKKGMIINASKKLTLTEINYILKYVVKMIKNPRQKETIENYGARGYLDEAISDILSIPIYEVKPIMKKYWENQLKQ